MGKSKNVTTNKREVAQARNTTNELLKDEAKLNNFPKCFTNYVDRWWKWQMGLNRFFMTLPERYLAQGLVVSMGVNLVGYCKNQGSQKGGREGTFEGSY